MRPLLAFAASVACCGTAGCGVTLNTSANFYHSYGDSITAGYSLSSPSKQAYPALVAVQHQYDLINVAISGSQACDVPTQQIIPHVEDPTLTTKGLYTLLISTNDVQVKGTGAYEQVFNLCHQATIAWLALPMAAKVLGTDPRVATVGATHLETENGWNAITTDALGSSVSFPLTVSSAGPVYVWYRITDGNSGTFTYSIDSVPLGNLHASTSPAIITQAGIKTSMALLRIAGVPAGLHAITFTQTSSSPSGAGIVAVGVPPAGPSAQMPHLFVGLTPPQLSSGSGVCSKNDSPCQAYRADITENVALLAGDHLDVATFDTGKYMTATLADMTDSLHPNALGHQEIAEALEDALALQ